MCVEHVACFFDSSTSISSFSGDSLYLVSVPPTFHSQSKYLDWALPLSQQWSSCQRPETICGWHFSGHKDWRGGGKKNKALNTYVLV